MRSPLALCALLLCAVVPASAADRAWKTGTWAPRTERGSYVIDTARDVITGEAVEGADVPALNATPGTRAQFAIVGGTLYVLDTAKVEHALKLLGAVARYSKAYAALGGGHYLTAVAPGGTSVTIEDGSRWDVEPARYFAVAEWQPDDLVSVRRAATNPDFDYEVDDTSRDDGAMANYRAR